MQQKGLQGLYLGRADRFQGEEVRACDEFLAYVTGFTGSAGALVMLGDTAAVFSDSRYSLQLENQLDPACFIHFDSAQLSAFEWIEQTAANGAIGFDSWQISTALYQQMQKRLPSIQFVPLGDDFLASFWEDRPAPKAEDAWWPDLTITGQTSKAKIADTVAGLKAEQADFALITSAESVNWLLNMRGRDLSHTPVKLCYALISQSGELVIIGADSSVEVGGYQNVSFDNLEALLNQLEIGEDTRISCDPGTLPVALYHLLEQRKVDVCLRDEPIISRKACKNEAEINGFRKAHLLDGLAMVEFSFWLKNEADLTSLQESDVADYLTSIRAKQNAYICDSFATISGFNANGAIVHYRAEKGKDASLSHQGILLCDSGAHYQMGTTDITRCFGFGEIPAHIKKAATIVLGGHADLAMAQFPVGTNGTQLDALARQHLWKHGYDYGHGTGHGVGHILGVHEGPVNLSKRGNKPLTPGLILSNEPGYYQQGEFGIRHENLVHTIATSDGFLAFETITLCPFDRDLIDAEYLTAQQTEWLNDYHHFVYQQLSPHLNETHAAWLKQQTAPL